MYGDEEVIEVIDDGPGYGGDVVVVDDGPDVIVVDDGPDVVEVIDDGYWEVARGSHDPQILSHFMKFISMYKVTLKHSSMTIFLFISFLLIFAFRWIYVSVHES